MIGPFSVGLSYTDTTLTFRMRRLRFKVRDFLSLVRSPSQAQFYCPAMTITSHGCPDETLLDLRESVRVLRPCHPGLSIEG